MKNTVFTIVAKNYLPLAQALGWSLKHNNSADLNFIIFLADEPDGNINLNKTDETIIAISQIGIDHLSDWAFKYDITEFCTAVKPACFKYVFNILKSENAIYFDPDIFVFNSLAQIFNELNRFEIVITPHYVTPQINYSGDQRDMATLFVGIYNFGFVAFKNTERNEFILNWWQNRLSNQCYADRQDSLHTDQKWADFLPVYASETLLISKSIGYNLAPWNLFEREIIQNDTGLLVRNRLTGEEEPLLFVHFAGYDPDNLNLIHKDFWEMPISKYPDYDIVRKTYNRITTEFNFRELRNLVPYTYSTFSNGYFIQNYHRRIYRAIIESGKVIENPFSEDGEFYKSLLKNGLISKTKPLKVTRKTYSEFDKKVRIFNFIFRIISKILGSEKYFLLLKLLNRYSRPENQTFLIEEKISKFY